MKPIERLDVAATLYEGEAKVVIDFGAGHRHCSPEDAVRLAHLLIESASTARFVLAFHQWALALPVVGGPPWTIPDALEAIWKHYDAAKRPARPDAPPAGPPPPGR
jgi:hypothetical protein